MELNLKPHICRVCLLTSDDSLNIWQTFEDSTIASILAKHFWFEVNKNDGLTEWLCKSCWIQTKTFHEFYAKVEQYHKYLLDTVEKDTDEPDAGIDNSDAASENDLKCEATDLKISKDDISDYSDDDDCDESETEAVSDQALDKKFKTDDYTDTTENERQNAQIRELFTMKCDICSDVEFETLFYARRHYMKVHKTRGYLMCCEKKFWILPAILNHIHYHQSNAEALSKTEEENAQIREVFTMKCDICSDVEFENLFYARRHYLKVHKTKGYLMCCEKKFWILPAILDHIRYHQSNPEARSKTEEVNTRIRELFTMNCEICSNVEFKTFRDASRHYHKVHKTRGYLMCCGRKFYEQQKILDHIRCHQSNPEVSSQREEENARIREFFTMKCEICSDVKFHSLVDARRHYRKVHKTKGYLMCCGKKFQRRHRALDHMLTHINPDAVRCDHCVKSFQNKSALKMHMYTHVPLDARAHRCTQCPRRFAKETLLKRHVKSQHDSKTGEKFPCDKCGKNFRSNILLGSHIRMVHECSLHHVCEICARQCKTRTTLANHIISQHSTTPQPRVQCDICGAWLKHRAGLKLHLRTQHQDGNVEDFKCPTCDKVKKNKRTLAKHIDRVHGERRHPCGFCDKAFKTPKNLKEHIALHTGEYLYNCSYCEKKFKSNANMYSHRKKAHVAEWTRDSAQRGTLKSNSTTGLNT